MTVAEYRPTIAGLLREGIRSTFSDRGGLLSYGLVTTLLLTAAWYADELNVFGDSYSSTICAEAGLFPLAFAWHRRHFIGPENDSWLPSWPSDEEFRHVTGLALVYALRALLLVGTIVIAGVGVGIGFYYSFPGVASQGVAVLLALLLVPVLVVATARFLLVFPAYASGKRMSWLQSWRLCRGLGLRLGVAVLLTWLPLATVFALSFALPVPVLESIAGDVVHTLLISGSQVLGWLVALSITAHLYERLTEPADCSDFD